MEIEVLRRHGFSLRRIAAEVGCAVNTAHNHLATGQKPKHEREKSRPSKLSPCEGYLRERQGSDHPQWIPATVLFREVAAQGYRGGLSQLRKFLRTIKPHSQAGASGLSFSCCLQPEILCEKDRRLTRWTLWLTTYAIKLWDSDGTVAVASVQERRAGVDSPVQKSK